MELGPLTSEHTLTVEIMDPMRSFLFMLTGAFIITNACELQEMDEDFFADDSSDPGTDPVDSPEMSDNVEFRPNAPCADLQDDQHWRSSSIEFDSKWEGIPHAGPGVASADFDRDGDFDLAFPTWDEGVQFWRQEEPGVFAFWDLAHPDVSGNQIYGLSAADFDGDGFMDLLVAGRDVLSLWRGSEDGFDDVTQDAGLTHEANVYVGADWGDYDHDDDLDLVVACHEPLEWENEIYTPCPNKLFRNDGGSFEPVDSIVSSTSGVTHVVKWIDFDRDGDLDLFVGNDKGFYIQNSELWENQLAENGTWTDRFTEAVGVLEAPMGVSMDDFDMDGTPDLWITDVGGNRLYRGQGGFSPLIDVTGVWFAVGENRVNDVAWSVLPVDMDGDGRREVVVTYGYGGPVPDDMEQSSRTFFDEGEWAPLFRSVPEAIPDRKVIMNARGALVTDLNGDGAPDVVARHVFGPPDLLLGLCNVPRLMVELWDNTTLNRFGVGALVEADFGGWSDALVVGSTSGSYSSGPPALFFSPGEVTFVHLRVFWPDGEETFANAPTNGVVKIFR